jgi:hypothetical protein
MADVLSTVGVNANKFVINTSDAGREVVVKAAKENMTNADLLAVYRQLTVAGGADKDAGTVAGFGTANGSAFESGVTDAVFFRVQTTGTPDTTTVSGVTLTVEAVFRPAL